MPNYNHLVWNYPLRIILIELHLSLRTLGSVSELVVEHFDSLLLPALFLIFHFLLKSSDSPLITTEFGYLELPIVEVFPEFGCFDLFCQPVIRPMYTEKENVIYQSIIKICTILKHFSYQQ